MTSTGEPYTIYSMDGCSACKSAALLLKQRDESFTVLQAGIEFTTDELNARVGKPVRSLPQIFQGEKYIGSFADLQQHLN